MTLSPQSSKIGPSGMERDQAGAREIQRPRRTGDVRDDEVDHRAQPFADPQPGVEARRAGEERGRGDLGPVLERACRRCRRACPWRRTSTARSRARTRPDRRSRPAAPRTSTRPGSRTADLPSRAPTWGSTRRAAVGELVAIAQVGAQRPGRDREHDVVDGHVERVLHRLDVGERHRRERDDPARRDRAVHRQARRGQRERDVERLVACPACEPHDAGARG